MKSTTTTPSTTGTSPALLFFAEAVGDIEEAACTGDLEELASGVDTFVKEDCAEKRDVEVEGEVVVVLRHGS